MALPVKSIEFQLSVAETIPHNLLLYIQPLNCVLEVQVT